VTGPKFFAEALAEYEDAVVYYEKCEKGLGGWPWPLSAPGSGRWAGG
jgi:hypothetical protein